MKINDLDILKKNIGDDELYDLFISTFKFNTNVKLSKYIVGEEDEMRIDIICNNIYGNVDYIDFLLNINGISNPLNIMMGDELIYTDIQSINDYIVDNSNNIELNNSSSLINVLKETKKDNNRKLYKDNNYNLPPTVKAEPKPAVIINNNKIIIGQ